MSVILKGHVGLPKGCCEKYQNPPVQPCLTIPKATPFKIRLCAFSDGTYLSLLWAKFSTLRRYKLAVMHPGKLTSLLSAKFKTSKETED